MSNLVSDLIGDNVANHMRNVISVGGIAGAITTIIPPAAVVAVPVAVGLVFAQWVYMVYQETPGVIRTLMGYIVDLTIVMQSLFWLVQSRNSRDKKTKALPLDPRLIKLAIQAYRESGDRTRVHHDIQSYVGNTNAFSVAYHKDKTLEKVVQLIKNNRFEPPEKYKRNAVPILEDGYGWVEEPEELDPLL